MNYQDLDRNISGWLLIIGPIVILLSFLGWPNVETASEQLAELAKNPSRSIVVMSAFLTGMTLLFTGLSISSRTLAAEETKWSTLTLASAFLFPSTIAVMLISVGLSFGAVRLYETSIEHANAIYLIGYHVTDVVGFTMGIAFVLFGVALLGRYGDLWRKGIGILYFIIGICHLIAMFVEGTNAKTDVWGYISWISMFIVSIAFGIVVLRYKSRK